MTVMSASLQNYQARIEDVLTHVLPADDLLPARLHAAMRYAVLGGGKRMRPLLVYATGEALGLNVAVLDTPAAAVELIHAYSLVHDDLPAMDDDNLRRGQPTCHCAYDEATAILAGDALQTLAFQLLASTASDIEAVPAAARLQMLELLAQASGSRGMVGGQALDLAAVGCEIGEVELENMHIHKTGALIRACVLLAAYCDPNIDETRLQHLDHYAKCVGLAFQVQDDILDVESETGVLGKTKGADAAANKPTYPSIIGMKAAKDRLQTLYNEALRSLEDFEAPLLREVAAFTVKRLH